MLKIGIDQYKNYKYILFFLIYFISIYSSQILGMGFEDHIYITELMASNGDTYTDSQGAYSDWIEIYNPLDQPIDLAGFYFSDDEDEPDKWQIPYGWESITTIAPEDFLILWADGKPERGPLHLDFKLSKEGEEVILSTPTGKSLDQVSFSEQIRDISYGRQNDRWRYFVQPTPKQVNDTKGWKTLNMATSYRFYLNNTVLIWTNIVLFIILLLVIIYLIRIFICKRRQDDELKWLLKKHHILLDNVKIQIWYLLSLDQYGGANKTHQEFIGVEQKDLEKRSIFKIFTETEAKKMLENNAKAFTKKEEIKSEEWLVDANGEQRLLAITRKPILDDVGEVKYLVCTAEDITEQKWMEDQIRYLAREYETIISNTHDAIFLIDVEETGTFTYKNINFTFIQLFNLLAQDVMGKRPSDIFGDEIGKYIEDQLDECLKQKKIVTFEGEIGVTDQSLYLHTNLCPIIIEGKVAQIVGSARDITDLKKMETRLQRNAEEYRALFEESPIGLIKADIEGNIVDINKEMLEIMGSPGKDISQEFNLIHLKGLQEVGISQKFVQVVADGKPLTGETFYKSHWGKEFWLRYHLKPIIMKGNTVSEVVIVCEDITKRKHAEARIKDLTFKDTLTGLYNRTYFNEELKKYNAEEQLPLSIIIGDVNGLKMTNDVFGHKKGDELLLKISEAIKGCCRMDDLIARWGGDEFIILLPHTDIDLAAKIEQRIKEAISQIPTAITSASIALGSATKYDSNQDVDVIFKRAEDEMYKNKLRESRSTHLKILAILRERLTDLNLTEQYQRRKYLAERLAQVMGLPDSQIENVNLLAECQDLGVLILSKEIFERDHLTPEELKRLKEHPEVGYKIAKSTSKISSIADEILSHHERWDGTGYPLGLKGEDIPILSRLIAVVNAFIAIVDSEENVSPEVIDKLQEWAGSKLDPKITQLFIQHVLKENN